MSDTDIVAIVRELLLVTPRVSHDGNVMEFPNVRTPRLGVKYEAEQAIAAGRYNAALTRAVDWLIAQQPSYLPSFQDTKRPNPRCLCNYCAEWRATVLRTEGAL